MLELATTSTAPATPLPWLASGDPASLAETTSATWSLPAGAHVNDADSMHARFYNPLLGRFLSTDRARGSLRNPQSWNRYAYALGNPVKHIDPDGLRAREYQWKQYIFRLDKAHGGPHVDVLTKDRALLGRVSRATGELLEHGGSFGSVPNVAMKYMQSKKWIPGLFFGVGLALDILTNPDPVNAMEPSSKQMQAQNEANDAYERLASEVAADLFGPVQLSSLTDEEIAQVEAEIGRRAEDQDAQRKRAEDSLNRFTSFGCWYTGGCGAASQ